MNINVWNIKDTFSFPPGTGTNKSSARNSVSTEHSSLTDSQFVFGSQFCADMSQPGSLEFPAQSKQQTKSQNNSQDSDPSVYVKYQTKPPLYGSDFKDKSFFLPLGGGKSKGIFEQFEENKKKAKEKNDKYESINSSSNTLLFFPGQLHLKMIFCHFDENLNSRCKSILDSLETNSRALQDDIASHHGQISKTLSSKNNLEQILFDLENKIQSRDTEITDLKANVQSLLSCVGLLKSQQCEQHLQLSEKILFLSDYIKSSENKILGGLEKISLVSELAVHMKDSAAQTSPTRVQDIFPKDSVKPQPNGSALSQVNSSKGTNNTLSAQFREGLTTNKCIGSLQRPSDCLISCVKTPAISVQEDHMSLVSPFNNQSKKMPKTLYQDKRKVKSAHDLPNEQLNQNTSCKMFVGTAVPSSGKENVLPNKIPETNHKNIKRKRVSKKKISIRKQRTSCSVRNKGSLVSKSVDINVQHNSKEASVTWALEEIAQESPRNTFNMNSDSCEPSLSVTHAPARNILVPNRENYSAFCSHQTKEHSSSTEDEICTYWQAGLSKSEQKVLDWNFSSHDNRHLHYSKKNEKHMTLLSPLHAEKTFLSLFFDSSDNSN